MFTVCFFLLVSILLGVHDTGARIDTSDDDEPDPAPALALPRSIADDEPPWQRAA